MRRELEKNYNSSIEAGLYQKWLDSKYFRSEVDESKPPFCIVIPPPNITGVLHIGHALNCSIQDAIIRFKRMQGYNALWLPGTDHASISTELKIVNAMANEGLTKEQVGREEFLRRAWKWKDQYGGTIISQLKKLGCSCDWERERFTMDEGLSRAVLENFIRLYDKGWIYRGEKLINWCTKCMTTISDAEVEHEDKQGFFWYFKYPVKGTDEFIQFATTRPETMLGDTAIAVNPKDERYAGLVGKTAVIPVIGREIPIIADNYVESDFGTGVVKITPAHDPNDFEVGERHGLARINIMDDDGTINENGGKYAGMHKSKAREAIIRDFDELGLFVKKENISHAVATHDRCGEVIEPLIKSQWFVKMQDLAKPALEVLNDGRLKFVHERYAKIYVNWLENIRDWCISRQLWWGHRIPAYYCQDCGNTDVGVKIEKCSKCGSANIHQDEDVLDTWFSSALWPFSMLGWPDDTEDLKYYYPTSVLVTSYDIIFFWVIRMVFSGMELANDVPFRDVLIHGLVRDSQGRKMSKSTGNGINPLEVIEKYGADALRLSLIIGNSLEGDMRFGLEKLESNRNFLNKIWNAARFLLMNLNDETDGDKPEDLTVADKWILSRMNELTKNVTANLEAYDLGVALQKVYDFVWDEYCDWYIEIVKPRLYNSEDKSRSAALWTLKTVLCDALKLLHPFIPFITEEIFLALSGEESIMISEWPKFSEEMSYPNEEREIEFLKSSVKSIRNIRSEMNVAQSRKIGIIVVTENQGVAEMVERCRLFFGALAGVNEITVKSGTEGLSGDEVSLVIENAVIYIPFADLVDIQKENERLSKEKMKLEAEVERCEGKLSNEGFLAKAPQKLLDEERSKLDKYREMLAKIEEQLIRLSKWS